MTELKEINRKILAIPEKHKDRTIEKILGKNIIIGFDASLFCFQLKEVKTLLENLPSQFTHDLIREINKLSSDVVLGDPVSTNRADGIVEFIQPFWLGIYFENFMTTLGAMKINFLHNKS